MRRPLYHLRRYPYVSLAIASVLLGTAGVLYAQTLGEGRVGPNYSADGTNPVIRQDRYSCQVVQSAGGKYSEAVVRGNCYSAMTAATGVSAASLTQTTTGQFTLANPTGSNRNCRVLQCTVGYVSGTFGAGNLTYSVNSNPLAAAVTGTAIVPVNNLVGTANSAAAKPFTTSTLPVAPTPIRNLANIGAWVGTTASPLWNITDDVDGAIVLTPGSAVTVTGTTAAGTTPVIVVSMMWEELVP